MNSSLPTDLCAAKQGLAADAAQPRPLSALIHLNRNNGIENFYPLPQDEFKAEQEHKTAEAIVNKLPPACAKRCSPCACALSGWWRLMESITSGCKV